MLNHSSRQRRNVCIALVGAMTGVSSHTALAQASAFPGDKPIKLIVPFSPGGQTDSAGRLLANHLGKELKANVIVENIPGAASTIGVARAARAEPDGHTMVQVGGTAYTVAPVLYPSLPYKPKEDFIPIGKIGDAPLVVIASPTFPASNIQELIALVQRQDGKMLYAAWGVASGGHLLMEGLNQHARLRMEQVAYKGEAPVLQAMLGGEVQLGVSSLGSALPHLKAGKMKALGILSSRRSGLQADIPTLVEQGVPLKAAAFHALFVPAKTPAPIVETLSQALSAAIARPEVHERLRDLGIDTNPVSRDAFMRQIEEDAAVWKKIVVSRGIKVE